MPCFAPHWLSQLLFCTTNMPLCVLPTDLYLSRLIMTWINQQLTSWQHNQKIWLSLFNNLDIRGWKILALFNMLLECSVSLILFYFTINLPMEICGFATLCVLFNHSGDLKNYGILILIQSMVFIRKTSLIYLFLS